MHSVHTHQELVYSLARSGDPSAFYTLVAQFANAAYIAERNSGKSHKEALSVLIPFMKKAYQNFVSTIHQNPFDIWYRDYKKKYFHATLNRHAPAPPPEDADFENIPMTDVAHFGAIVDLVLQRQYGKYRRAKKNRIVQRLAMQFMQLHWILKTAFIFALLVMGMVIALSMLALSKQQLMVTFLSRDSHHSVVFPFPETSSGAWEKLSNDKPVADSSALKKVHDTVKVHDTIRTVIKNYQGNPVHSSGGSSSMSTASTPVSPSGISPVAGVSTIPGQQAPARRPSPIKTVPLTPNPDKSSAPSVPTPAPSVKSAYDSLQ